MSKNHFVRGVACLAALVALAACSATEPVPEVKLDPLPLEGRWIVTTALDTFSFETGNGSPGCTVMYCTNYRADTVARLSIAMTFAGDSVGGGGVRQYRLVSDSVSGLFCDVVDYRASPGGCTHHAPVAPLFYASANVTPSGGVLVPNGTVAIDLRGPNREIVRLRGSFAGDSIVGRVYWAQFETRSPPAHYGAFTARRQH